MKNLLLLLLGLTLAGTVRAAEPPARPNILLCMADDWGWPHAIQYGDKVVKTPNFDRVVREGMLFTNAFCSAPTCSASRAAMLTGQFPHRLEEGGNLWGFLPHKFPVYPDLLEAAGYHSGSAKKAWGPGNFQAGGFTHNPGGPAFPNLDAFLKGVPAGEPFCFWLGSREPHRPYKAGEGVAAGLKPEDVTVPPYLPDAPEVRADILDYYAEVQEFDRQVGEALATLEKAGLLENTLVVVSGDNGWPFPRSKANCYDSGVRQPMAVRWPGHVKPGGSSDAFVNLMDLAPTFLEAAGVKPPSEMTGRSLVPLLTGAEAPGGRERIVTERERHADVRPGNLSYPIRALRTRDFLYVRNFHPERWPAGDPDYANGYGDIDAGGSKDYMVAHQDDPALREMIALSLAKRPAEELYDVHADPFDLHNLAADPAQAEVLAKLRAELEQWMRETADPRAGPNDDPWDRYPYYGPPLKRAAPAGKP